MSQTPESRVAQRFASRTPNRQTGRIAYRGRNVFCDATVMYSYGNHFPLALYLGEQKKTHLFLKNGDKYSDTTSRHQGETQHYCKGPTVSCSALEAAGFHFLGVKLENIICYQPDMHEHLYKNLKTGKYFKTLDYKGRGKNAKMIAKDEFKPPRQGMFIPYRGGEDDGYISGYWHVLGACVLVRDGRHFLASLDEGRYFVSELPYKVTTIAQAFKSLQPPEVQKAIKAGLNVLRQGEWFFVPTGWDTAALAKKLGFSQKNLLSLATEKPLPGKANRDNLHCCRWIQLVTGPTPGQGPMYARGKVFHRHGVGLASGLTGEHRTVRLGENLNEWYRVYHNAEKESWSMGGRFD